MRLIPCPGFLKLSGPFDQPLQVLSVDGVVATVLKGRPVEGGSAVFSGAIAAGLTKWPGSDKTDESAFDRDIHQRFEQGSQHAPIVARLAALISRRNGR
jgi:hypothetical protein